MTNPQKDEHIEELLSKLQGIFGKLSHSEEEEAKQKIVVPESAPKEKAPEETPSVDVPAKPTSPAPINMYAEPPSPPAPASVSPPAPTPAAAPPPVSAVTSGGYTSMVPLEDPEKLIVPTAVFYPPGREAEAKSLAQKLETMTPKFTKVAFRLRVCVFFPYDPKSDWKETILLKSGEIPFQTVFVVMDRPMEDTKRKAVAADLEGRNIYFQEVTFASIEKKAFYTDILLGLVFFFDSRKPKEPGEGSAS